MYTLCRHDESDAYEHAIAYYNSISASTESGNVIRIFFERLCAANVTEAFLFARCQHDKSHHNLWKRLIEQVLKLPSGPEKAAKSAEMVLLPMDNQEATIFSDFLRSGPGSRLPGANDSLIMRTMVLGGRYKETNHRKRTHGKIDGLDWRVLQEPSR